jgi:CBS domain-containing protein
MKVKELMTQAVRTSTPDAPLSEAAKVMWERDCGVVPIVDAQGRVAGVVTDRDACMAAYTQGKPLSAIPIRSVMSTSVHTCRPDDDLAQAEETMSRHQVRRLPVVDGGDRLVGILSLNDVARRAEQVGKPAKQDVAGVLADVGRSRQPGCPA